MLFQGGHGNWYAETEADEHVVDEGTRVVEEPAGTSEHQGASPPPAGLTRNDSKRSLYGTAARISGEAAQAPAVPLIPATPGCAGRCRRVVTATDDTHKMTAILHSCRRCVRHRSTGRAASSGMRRFLQTVNSFV